MGIAAWAWVKRRPQISAWEVAKIAESVESLREDR
jgi:hypothetical protein